MTTRETTRAIVKSRNPFALIGVFLLVAVVMAVPFYSARSSSLSRGYSQPSSKSGTAAKLAKTGSRAVSSPATINPWSSPFVLVGPAPQPFAEGIATFASDCTTPQSDFFLGDVVCAKASGVPVTLFPWHVLWIDPVGFVRQSNDASPDDTTQYMYQLPATPTSDVNGQTVDNRGTWKVNLARSNGAVRQTALFTVHQQANPVADVFVQKFVHSASASVASGDNISFSLVVGNGGPDAGVTVHLVDSVPTGATLVQFTQNSGPACVPVTVGVDNNCIIANMANGDRAEFTAIYNTGGMTPGDYETSATVSATTTDSNSDNNTSTAQFTVTASNGGTSCQLICPDNINATANTTEGGQRGAHVTYDPPVTSGSCGSVSSVPASGSFFPVGTTAVNATSETGGGSCSFTVTVTDNGTNPPTITCPPNKTADADGDCEATVVLGTPTTTGDNVTVVGSRSDGKPMYDCDANGNNCTRKNPDLPFSAGVTTVTWTATSHDAQGNNEGTASCQQTVTVNDTTPPVITATDQTVSADANCQAAVPDYSNQVTDNCSCASNDNSQDCVGQHRITTTQSTAAGTMVGPGTYTIHLTANDGSSNNNGAGNTTTKDVTFTVKDTTPPTITCPPNMTANTEPGTCSAHVVTGTATATDNCDANPAITGTRSDGKPLTDPYPKGTTTITWTATDSAGNHSSCDQTITVVDNEPPVIVLNGQTPSMWPPNHKYHTFGVTNFVTGVTDNCDTISVSSVVITMVTSDEAENGNGSGNTLNDIVIAPDCRSVQLRAEREGGGDGRVYRIFFSVTDTSGNVGTASATVVVQHNPGETVVDSGPHYAVSCGGL
jgi:uncharacterized repeat protein (TIGR01451 family)